MRTETLDDNTRASYPGQIRLSRDKLRVLLPELDSFFAWLWFILTAPEELEATQRSFWLTRIEEHLFHGDSRASVVVSTSPLLVAAYSDELDCVAMLHFDDKFVRDYDLRIGSRLINVNTYFDLTESYQRDLEPGPNARGAYGNFTPLIADFLSDDVKRISERKVEIDEDEWRLTAQLGAQYLAKNGITARDGRPLLCSFPAKRLDGSRIWKFLMGEPRSSPISTFEIFKRIFILICFVMLTLWSIREVYLKPRVGWTAVIVFGLMTTLAAIYVFRIPKESG